MKKILLIIILIMAIFQMVTISANLFADGLEGGTTGAWSAVVDTESDMTVAAGAALHGGYGLNLLIDNNTVMYVSDTTPSAEIRYRCRFYIDPNGLAMANLEQFAIVQAGGVNNLLIELCYTTVASYQIIVHALKDTASNDSTAKYAITDAPHCIEVDWKASTGAGNNDGYVELIIDGVSKEVNSGIDNDTKVINTIYFGAVAYIDANTSGAFFLDDFASNNDGTAIGVITEAPAGNAIMFGINF